MNDPTVQVDLATLQQVHAETLGALELEAAKWRQLAQDSAEQLRVMQAQLLEVIAERDQARGALAERDESADVDSVAGYAGNGDGLEAT